MSATITRPLFDSTDSLLRFAFRVDGTLTALSGVVGALAAGRLSALVGLSPAQQYGLAAWFVVYGLLVYSLSALPEPRSAGVGVMIANSGYAVAAVLVAVAGVVPMTPAGVAAALANGGYAAFFAWLQYLGVRRLA